jgi:plastocyanin
MGCCAVLLALAGCGGGGSGAVGEPSGPALTTAPSGAVTTSPATTPGSPKTTHPRKSASATAVRTTVAPTTGAPSTHAHSPRPTHTTSPKPKPTRSRSPQPCAKQPTAKTAVSMESNPADPTQPYGFSPTSISVRCGGSVAIKNNTAVTHNFSPQHGGFSGSGNVPGGGTDSVTFFYKGAYGFMCTIHTYMTGTVHVT